MTVGVGVISRLATAQRYKTCVATAHIGNCCINSARYRIWLRYTLHIL